MLKLKQACTYGPVRSRRLGSSLGVNLLPGTCKYCTFNCLYCQYGWTDYEEMESLTSDCFPLVEAVIREVEEKIKTLEEKPRYITFSGNGEPTVYPYFSQVVDAVIALRDKIAQGSMVAILSNSTTAGKPVIQKALRKLDMRIMKLDAGNPRMLSIYNQPQAGIDLAEIVQSLAQLGEVTIQALFSGGEKGNDKKEDLADWVECLKTISPRFVQIYSLDRDYPSAKITKLGTEELLEIKKLLDTLGIPCGIY